MPKTKTDPDTRSSPPPLIHEVHWDIDYRVRLGIAWSRFIRGLEARELWGTRCATCSRTYVPPQSYCESCFEAIEEWTLMDPVGTLGASTIVYQGFHGGPQAPYAVGAITIDGCQSQLMHFIGGVDLSSPEEARSQLRSGLRVRAVWSEQRSATILDIRHFAPAE